MELRKQSLLDVPTNSQQLCLYHHHNKAQQETNWSRQKAQRLPVFCSYISKPWEIKTLEWEKDPQDMACSPPPISMNSCQSTQQVENCSRRQRSAPKGGKFLPQSFSWTGPSHMNHIIYLFSKIIFSLRYIYNYSKRMCNTTDITETC